MSSQKNEEVLSRIPRMRVVDLKEELEKRGLPKSGSKQQLADRLKMNILIENQRESQKNAADDEQLPNISMREQLADQNPLIRDYFQSQAELFHSQKVVKKLYEDMSHAAEGEAAVQNVEMKENEENTSKAASVSPVKVTTRGGIAAAAAAAASTASLPVPVQQQEEREKIQEPPKLYEDRSQAAEAVVQNVEVKKTEENTSKAASVSPVKVTTRGGIAAAAAASTPSPPVPVEEPPKTEIIQEQPPPVEIVPKQPPPVEVVPEQPPPVEVIKEQPPPVEVIKEQPPPAEVIQEQPKIEVIQEPLKSPNKKESQRFERIQSLLADDVEEAASVSPVKVITRGIVVAAATPPAATPPLPGPVQQQQEGEKIQEPHKSHEDMSQGAKEAVVQNVEMKEIEENTSKAASVSPVKVKTRGGTAVTTLPPVPLPEKLPNVEIIQEPLKSPELKRKESRRKRFHSHLSDDVEKALDYGESKLKKDEDKVVQSMETNDRSEDAHVSRKSSFKASPIRIPTSPSPIPVLQEEEGEKIQEPLKSPELKRTESQRSKRVHSLLSEEIEEALDYGDEESRQKKEHDEVSWTRRILRLKNRCAVIEKSDKKWNRIDKKPVVVTSNVLETFFPDVKLLSDSELKLEDRASTEAAEKTFETQEKSQENGSSTEEKVEIKLEESGVPNVKRKISIIPFEESVKELTPPRNPPSNILIVTNLVRPFTLLQLREMLQRTGTIEDIWVDKIKSKCIAKFEKQEEAEETRAALHGIKWPLSNPKTLIVDYTNEEDFEDHRTKETGEKKIKIEKPSEAKGIPVREWDLGKRERSRSRSAGRRRRSGSERKRSRKSPSPNLRRHSRSPHHDKKSLRDLESKDEAREGKALDELFRKTTTTPCIYWLPLTPEQISEKEEMRRKRMLERERRLAQIEMAKERQHIRPR